MTDIVDLLGSFKKEFPNIEIDLYEVGSKKIEIAICDGLLDLGVICVPSENNGIYETIPFERDPLRIIMHRGHRLAQMEQVDYCDLKDERFILYNTDFGLHDIIMAKLLQAGIHPHVVFKTSQRELMTQTVSAGLGIAFLPSKICLGLDSNTIISLPMADSQLYLQLAIAWKKGRYLSHAACELLEYAKKNLRNLEPDLFSGKRNRPCEKLTS